MTRLDRIELWTQELRHAARGLAREPRFTAFVVLTLALAIGMNAAIVGVVDRLLVRGPAHIADQRRMVRLYMTVQPPGRKDVQTGALPFAAYDLFRTGISDFAGIAAYNTEGTTTFGHGADAELVNLGQASATFFPLLGVTPAAGRFFGADEDRPESAAHVVVLGYGLWRRALGGDSAVIGRTVELGSEPYTVIGIAPRGFTGAEIGRIDAWVPLSLRARNVANWAHNWDDGSLSVIARLARGATREHVAAALTAAYHRAYDGTHPVMGAGAFGYAPLRSTRDGRESPEAEVARWLAAVSLVVLLIACANVINLLIARAMRRRREVAVRLALGAGRGHVVRLLLGEGLMLSGAGALAGLALAGVAGTAMRATLLPNVEWDSPAIDTRVLIASFALALGTGIVVGIAPAFVQRTTELTRTLKSGARDGGRRTFRVRGVLTAVQAGLSVVLLVGAALFVRSLANVRALDLGIDPAGTVVVTLRRASTGSIADPGERARELARRNDFYPAALERLQQLPGVAHAAVSKGLPFRWGFTQKLRVPGLDSIPLTPGAGWPDVSAVSGDYFETVGTRVLRGRAFTPADRAGSEPVAIVNATMARTLWRGGDPVGQCMYTGESLDNAPCARIVGVVADARRFNLKEPPVMVYYLPLGQEQGMRGTGAFLLVRLAARAPASYAALRSAVTVLDPSISYIDVRTLQESVDPQLRSWKLGATMFSIMGLLALVMAALGLYSVVSYLVTERRHELGVRIALGAGGANIVSVVLRGSVGAAAIGVMLGLGVAFAAGGWLEPLLFGVSARDPGILAGVAAILMSIATVAGLVPAIRARRVDPIGVLRGE